MSRFTGTLAVSFGDDGRHATLLEQLVWEVGHLGSGQLVTVPQYFRSDGASIPRPLWWFMPPWGTRGTRAAILHDYLLVLLEAGAPHEFVRTRAEADRQFYLALLALGEEKIHAWICWQGVRIWSAIQTARGVYRGS